MDAQVIAATHHEEDLKLCKTLCENEKLQFHHATTEAQIKALVSKNPNSYVFCDIDSNEFLSVNGQLSRLKLQGIFANTLKPRQIFGMADVSVFDLPQNHQLGFMGHFIVRNYNEFGTTLLTRTLNALQKANPAGLDQYKDETAVVQKILLKESRQKGAAIEAIRRLLERRNIADRAVEMIAIAVDELIMNAIFNAPRDSSGVYYRKEQPRDADFVFNNKEIVTVTLAFSRDFVSIGVLDQFCSFDSDRAMSRIFKNYQSTSYAVNETVVGAGLGLRGIVASGLATSISSKPSYGTEVIISFPYYASFKETKTGFRSFSLNLLD